MMEIMLRRKRTKRMKMRMEVSLFSSLTWTDPPEVMRGGLVENPVLLDL